MMNINLNGILLQIINDLFKSGDKKICVDFNNPKIKEAFFKRADNVFYLSSGRHIKKGSWLFDKVMNEYRLQSYQINLSKVADSFGYYLVRGNRYLFAIKENVLNLYDKE